MSQVIRVLDEQEDRVETGPTRFGSDWPGVFIRGDNALWMAFLLREYLRKPGLNLGFQEDIVLRSLMDLLESCQIGPQS